MLLDFGAHESSLVIKVTRRLLKLVDERLLQREVHFREWVCRQFQPQDRADQLIVLRLVHCVVLISLPGVAAMRARLFGSLKLLLEAL